MGANLVLLWLTLAALLLLGAIVVTRQLYNNSRNERIKITAKIIGAFYKGNEDVYQISLLFRMQNLGKKDIIYSGFWIVSPFSPETTLNTLGPPKAIKPEEIVEHTWTVLTKRLEIDRVYAIDSLGKEQLMPPDELRKIVAEVNKRINFMDETHIQWFSV